MKVLVFILSAVCICSARYTKWSSNDIGVQAKEEIHQFHQFWSQLGDLLWEKDEESVKQLLEQVLKMHRPYHGDSTGHGMTKPNRPFTYQHIPRPSHDYGEEMMRPLNHKDNLQLLDGVSREIIDAEILRPFPQKHIMRPLHDRPVEIDNNWEKPLMHIMRPSYDRPAEIDDEMEISVPQKHIMRPLHDRPVEIDESELVESLRPLEAVSGEVKDQKVMLPSPYKITERPEDFRPVKVGVDMDHVMRPSFAPGKVVFDVEDLFRPSIKAEDNSVE